MTNDVPGAGITPLLVVAAAALVDADGRVLVQQRRAGTPMAGLWEFPGGKLEPGETPEQALVRELAEELAIGVPASCLTPAAFASEPPGDGAGGRHLLLLLFVARRWTGVPRALAAAGLRWARPVELHRLAMPPADRPLVALLEQLL